MYFDSEDQKNSPSKFQETSLNSLKISFVIVEILTKCEHVQTFRVSRVSLT